MSFLNIVLSLSGPVEMMSTDTPQTSSILEINSIASFGKSSKVFKP